VSKIIQSGAVVFKTLAIEFSGLAFVSEKPVCRVMDFIARWHDFVICPIAIAYDIWHGTDYKFSLSLCLRVSGGINLVQNLGDARARQEGRTSGRSFKGGSWEGMYPTSPAKGYAERCKLSQWGLGQSDFCGFWYSGSHSR